MATLRCKKCGGDLEITENSSICECIYCGSKETIPNVDNERELRLYDRANRLRMANEFDKAEGVYESIIEEFSEDAEAYWGLLLCKYGIEYVDDPLTGEKVPTCHRSSYESILDDNDFEMVMEFSDTYSRAVYRENAKKIDEIRRGIIEVSEKEKPYDIFICYKETSQTGERTVDSVIAQNVYNMLIEKGYRVFFSRITLEDKLGTEYEPYIFAALNSAKVMLAFGTDYDNYNAVWVKNEWSRFLKLMNKDKSKRLIPCYKDIDVSDIPKEFVNLQGQDMGKIGAEQDLLHGIQKILGLKKIKEERQVKSTAISKVNPTIDSYLKRVNIFIEDGNWEKADEYCEKVLDVEPECANAYLSKLLIDYKIKNMNEIKSLTIDCFDNPNFLKALKYSDDELKTKFEEYICCIYIANSNLDIIQNDIYNKLIRQIKKIVIPDGITSIGENTFEKWDKIEEVIIPNSVTLIGDGAFSGCTSLTKIQIPDSVTSIGDSAFSGCTSLTEIQLPESVTSIGDSAFSGCTSLTKIQIPENVTSIGDSAFEDCEALTKIIMPESVTSIGDSAFSGCTSLTEIQLPESVMTIGWLAFLDCVSLKRIKLPKNIKNIEPLLFQGCYSLIEIESPWCVLENGVILNNEKSTLIKCLMDNQNSNIYCVPDGIISIGDGALSGWTSLTKIQIPKSVTSIGAEAFSVCTSLTEIQIPESVTSIGDHAFADCEALTKIIIPESVTSIGDSAFSGCTSLTEIRIPDSIKEINVEWFSGCVSLKKIDSPWVLIENKGVFNNDKTKMIMCLYFEKETCVYILPEGVTKIGKGSFSGCSSIIEIQIPDSVTSIDDYAFSGCSSLKKIVIPDSVTSIGKGAFSKCTSLTEIQIPEGVTSIGDRAFEDCEALTKIIMPESVTSIGEWAFYECTSLKKIKIPCGVTTIGDNAFWGYEKKENVSIPEKFISDDELERIRLYAEKIVSSEAIIEFRKYLQESSDEYKKKGEIYTSLNEKKKERLSLNEELKSLFFLSPKKKEIKKRISILDKEIWEIERKIKKELGLR